MEINNENKSKFFGQYLFQRVLMWHDKSILYAVDGSDLAIVSTKKNTYYLLLKPLSFISDEDAIAIANFYGWKKGEEGFEDRILQFKIDLPCVSINGYAHKHLPFVFDFLRSKGYALPYMGLSVEQMVEAGWIKLTP